MGIIGGFWNPDDTALQLVGTETERNALVGPAEGQQFYVTDNDRDNGPYWYNGTSWRLPWNMPWGLVTATSGANPDFLTANTGSAGMGALTCRFVAVANRYYQAEFWAYGGNQSGAGDSEMTMVNTVSATVLQRIIVARAAGNIDHPIAMSYVWSPAAGDFTVTMAVSTTATDFTTFGGANLPLTLVIKDIGPNGAPT